ncbi:ribonuclease R [Amphibiibacter pelophylacis]|uniref:Ribonuclease R n=1 Tax=Amphibiibacter pelophylacis TaxID=1799477 RepID=A0ACC6P4I0_9BURK
MGHRDGFGFVVPESSRQGQSMATRSAHWLDEPASFGNIGSHDTDIVLSSDQMRTVMHRDVVRVRITGQDRRGRPEGQVVEILARQQKRLIGRLVREHGVWLVAPEDRRFSQDVLLPSEAACGEAREGQVVEVELTEQPTLYTQPSGHVVAVLGDIDDPGIEIDMAVRKFDLPYEFDAAVMDAAEKLPPGVRPADRRGRIDLTDVPLVTIDGEDARDFDDAVYAQPHPGDAHTPPGWRLIVAIADVSHYVKPHDAIDSEAVNRATSVYFPRRVIPMLPEKLSNGLCSLVPHQPRLALVCDMVIDGAGDIAAYQFYPAVIRSHERLTYTTVAAMLTNSAGPEAQKHRALLPHLIDLHAVYRVLLRRRNQRGAMEFETVETQMICDDDGRIQRIEPRTRNEAHRLIEEAMLAANVCAAEFIEDSGHPGLYRSHEGPTPEKRAALIAFLRAMGVGLSISDDPTPAEFQAIARATAGRPDALQIQTMLLRSMQQAIYSPVNSGHFGLAYAAYTHYTSPIRRYPDLLVHRVIKAQLQDRSYNIVTGRLVGKLPATTAMRVPRSQRPGAPAAAPVAMDAQTQAWDAMGAHCSACERRADEASRDVQNWLKCRFMSDYLGQSFSGKVSGVTAFGLFITLNEMYVEGLVHISELGGDYYRFDDVRQELRGERTGIRYRLGGAVQVQVTRVDLDARKIDLRLLRGDEALTEPPQPVRPVRQREALAELPPAVATSVALQAVQAQDQATKAQRRKLQATGSAAKAKPAAGKSAKPAKAAKKAPAPSARPERDEPDAPVIEGRSGQPPRMAALFSAKKAR